MQVVSLLTFSLAAWLTSRFCKPASRFYILDHPNERSLHTRPTPRTGGVAIFIGFVVGAGIVVWLYPSYRYLSWVLAGGLLVAVVSFLDDRWRLSPVVRFVFHLSGAGLVMAAGVTPEALSMPGWAWNWPQPLAIMLSLLFVVWMINLYNFMDGIDGLAGGMAVIGFGTLAVFGWMSGQFVYCIMNLLIASAAAGFLLFNFPPARIFMGDVGSAVLGLFAGAFSLWGIKAGFLPPWAALLVFSPFIIDATATLIRRLLAGERVWEAHKTHYYQRLVQFGWSHKKVVLWEYAVMLACSFSALMATHQRPAVQYLVLGVWALFYLGTALIVRRLEVKGGLVIRRGSP